MSVLPYRRAGQRTTLYDKSTVTLISHSKLTEFEPAPPLVASANTHTASSKSQLRN